MKQLFANRIYNSLMNITLSYGLLALAQAALAVTGVWQAYAKGLGADIASIVVASALTEGVRRLLYPQIKIQSLKMFSKKTLIETVAVLFVLVVALQIAEYVSRSQAYVPAGLTHFAMLVFVVAVTAPFVAHFVQRKGEAASRTAPAS
jgi:hypothetical protein